MKRPFTATALVTLICVLAVWINSTAVPQQQYSAAQAVSVSNIPHVIVDTAPTTAVTGPLTDAQLRNTPVPISGSVTTTMGALVNGIANIGIVRSVPSACTQSTSFNQTTVGVATGAGTTVTSTTTCVTLVYVNNTSNSAVTLRLADKAGTPVVWVGGNADFTIQPNGNVSFPLGGVLFTSGITAIAGTASALNLQVSGLQ
jgi:hypothetical protein